MYRCNSKLDVCLFTFFTCNKISNQNKRVQEYLNLYLRYTLVTQPMLQPTPNQTELRLMVSKSFFNVGSKNVSEKFLHRHSWNGILLP